MNKKTSQDSLVLFNNLYNKLIIKSNINVKNNLFFTNLNWKPWKIVCLFKFNNQKYFDATCDFIKICYKIIEEYALLSVNIDKLWYLQSNLVQLINHMFKNKEFIFINEYEITLNHISENIRYSNVFHNSLKFQVFINSSFDNQLMYLLKYNLNEDIKKMIDLNNSLIKEKQLGYNLSSLDFNHLDIYGNFALVYALYNCSPKQIIYYIISETSQELLTKETITSFELPIIHLLLFYTKYNKKDDNYIIYILELLFYYSKYDLTTYYDMYSNNTFTFALILDHSDRVIDKLFELQILYHNNKGLFSVLQDKNDFKESFISKCIESNRVYLLKKFKI